MVRGTGMRLRKCAYASRMGEFEAVKRLIIVANNAKLRSASQKIENGLLRAVQILVFVNQNMVIKAPLRRCRVVTKILVELGYDFTDQHAAMKPEPIDQNAFEAPILGVGSVARLYVL